MFATFIKTLFILTILSFFSVPIYALFADETYTIRPHSDTATFRFNNENWFTAPHPQVASFTMRDDGSAYGLTETGVSFVQYNIPNEAGIRIQRFEIEDHYHYIVEGEIIYTFAELSARLAQAYQEQLNLASA